MVFEECGVSPEKVEYDLCTTLHRILVILGINYVNIIFVLLLFCLSKYLYLYYALTLLV